MPSSQLSRLYNYVPGTPHTNFTMKRYSEPLDIRKKQDRVKKNLAVRYFISLFLSSASVFLLLPSFILPSHPSLCLPILPSVFPFFLLYSHLSFCILSSHSSFCLPILPSAFCLPILPSVFPVFLLSSLFLLLPLKQILYFFQQLLYFGNNSSTFVGTGMRSSGCKQRAGSISSIKLQT